MDVVAGSTGVVDARAVSLAVRWRGLTRPAPARSPRKRLSASACSTPSRRSCATSTMRRGTASGNATSRPSLTNSNAGWTTSAPRCWATAAWLAPSVTRADAGARSRASPDHGRHPIDNNPIERHPAQRHRAQELAVRRLRHRRPECRRHHEPSRHRQSQRPRAPRLVRRHADPPAITKDRDIASLLPLA